MPEAVIEAKLSDAEVAAAYDAAVCLACGGEKKPWRAFCATDMAALTIFVRNDLAAGPAWSGFADAFRSALRHLQLNPTRQRRFGEWPHATHEDLHSAGYRYVSAGQCRAPRCLAAILWYRSPRGYCIAVDRAYQPHVKSCRDPEFVQRLRERRAQTSARRKRAR